MTRAVDTDELDRLLEAWMWSRTVPGPDGRRVIALDGKTVSSKSGTTGIEDEIAMKRRIITLGVATVLPAAVLCLGLAAFATSGHQPDMVKLQATDDTTIIIDPIVGETFTPVGFAEAPRTGIIGPDEAYRRYAGKSVDLPHGSHVQLGYLTLPLGPGDPDQYTAKDELVYAYTLTSCAPQIAPPPPLGKEPSGQTPALACTQWLFVDASTGEMVDLTWTE